MRADQQIIDALNEVLTLELTAVNQYFIHARMLGNWGLNKLEKQIYDESMGEMKHADKLIKRVLFLEGVPEIARYNPIRVGKDVELMFKNDLAAELTGVELLNKHIGLCSQLKDGGSRELLEDILKDSEEHVDWIETQLERIKQVGLQNYLAQHLHG
jgi:bacterioferritin